MHDVGQVQHERRLGHVHRRAVRLERVGDRADGVLVLLEVLARAGERGGQGEVALVGAGTPDGAGQHARGDQAALAADQHLRASRRTCRRRGRSSTSGSSSASRAQRPAHVDRCGGGRDQVAGEHDLLEVARLDPADGLGHDGHPVLAVEGAVGEDHALGGARRARRAVVRRPVIGGADQGQPGAAGAAADHDPRDRQHRVARVVGEAERAEADQAGAGLVRRRRGSRRGRTVSVHHLSASEKRVSPRVRIWAATPQPTRPSSRRSQVTGSASAGSRSSSGPPTGSSVVRTVRLLVTVGKRTRLTLSRARLGDTRCRRRHRAGSVDGQDQ